MCYLATTWYIYEKLPYFSPAIIYNAPVKLKPAETLRVRYRVPVHEGKAIVFGKDGVITIPPAASTSTESNDKIHFMSFSN